MKRMTRNLFIGIAVGILLLPMPTIALAGMSTPESRQPLPSWIGSPESWKSI